MDAASDDETDRFSQRTLVGSTTSTSSIDDVREAPVRADSQNHRRRHSVTSNLSAQRSVESVQAIEHPPSDPATPSSLPVPRIGRSETTQSRSSSATILPSYQEARASPYGEETFESEPSAPQTAPRRVHQAGQIVRRVECPAETLVPAVCLSSLAAGAIGLIVWRSIDPKAGQS